VDVLEPHDPPLALDRRLAAQLLLGEGISRHGSGRSDLPPVGVKPWRRHGELCARQGSRWIRRDPIPLTQRAKVRRKKRDRGPEWLAPLAASRWSNPCLQRRTQGYM